MRFHFVSGDQLGGFNYCWKDIIRITSVHVKHHVSVKQHREEQRDGLQGDELKVIGTTVPIMHIDGRDPSGLR